MKKILLLLWGFLPFPLMADQVIFNRTFGGSGNDFAHAVVQTADGGFIVCGQTDSYGFGTDLRPDMWIIKLDPKGDKEWDKTYGGREADAAFAIQQTTDMGYVVAGTTSSFGKGYPAIWILKLDAKGDSVWSAWFEGSQVSTARSIVQTSDGGYIIAGSGKENILKLDKEGKKEWGKKYGWVFYAIEQTNDGGYVAAGDSIFKPQEWSYIPSLTVVKLDREGNREWKNPYGNSFLGSAFSVHQTTDGGYILSGDSIAEKSAWDHSHYAFAAKLDKDGKTVWKHFGPENSAAQSICQTGNGGYAAAGNRLDEDNGMNVFIFMVDKKGKEKWEKSYGSTPQWEYASSIQQTTDKGFVVAGQTESSGAGFYDVWILKVDGKGELKSAEISDPVTLQHESPLLIQNYPNPFIQSTTLTFSLPEPEFVTLRILDISGRTVETISCGYFPSGESSIIWERRNLPGGIYLFRLEAGKLSGSGQFILQ